MTTRTPITGYAPVNGLQLYYEIHGDGVPLVLLHGALSGIETSSGAILPALAGTRRVIALEQQAHGRTADNDRPLRIDQLTDDTAAALRYLGFEGADVLGYSLGTASRSSPLLVTRSSSERSFSSVPPRGVGVPSRPARERSQRATGVPRRHALGGGGRRRTVGRRMSMDDGDVLLVDLTGVGRDHMRVFGSLLIARFGVAALDPAVTPADAIRLSVSGQPPESDGHGGSTKRWAWARSCI
jgi:hypothetical protein